MPTLHFEAIRPGGRELVVDVAGRERLLDVCDATNAPVAFSCRGATCGTCRVVVLEGLALLEPPDEAEREFLRGFGAQPETRLACQAVVREGSGLVRLRWGG